ncbi:hypothetical protein [Streptomyces carpinensis]|uniref:Secreted protein n=1 Tax=Streptomyces carpinensis TaxID=66369 RepID=A0ABV1WD35_9ACTN|nr:hypothetical protein [Streptomyces carpinensis]
MSADQTQALIGMLVTFGLLVLMVLPSVIGIVHDRRVDRQLSKAGEDREDQKDRESRKAPKEGEEAQKSSSRSTVPSTATWYAEGRRSKKLVSS